MVYSLWANEANLTETGAKGKAWRIDLVLFVNGLSIATLELKSELKQAVHKAINKKLRVFGLIRSPKNRSRN